MKILTLSLAVRLLVLVIAAYTYTYFGWQRLLLGWDWNMEGFLDYFFWYVSGGEEPQEHHGFTRLFLAGELPYRDWAAAYNMTPLFLFMLAPFWALPLGVWGPGIPIVVCDALMGVVIYGIGKTLFHDEKKAKQAGILAALAPVNLFYVGYLWLNPGIFTFFAMASLYYLLNDKHDTSAILLGLAVMSKQVAVIFFPVVLLFVWRNRGGYGLLRYFLIFTAICVVISAPFLVVYPNEYINMLRSRAPRPVTGVYAFPKFNETVSLTALLQYYQIPDKIIGYVGWVINTYVAFIVALVIVVLSLEQETREKGADSQESRTFFFMAAFAAMTIMIALFPLGVYKYYMASLAPFWALYSVEAGHELSSRRFVGRFLAFGLWAIFNGVALFAPRIWNPYLAAFPFIVVFLPRVLKRPSALIRPLNSLRHFMRQAIGVGKELVRRF
ncbi:MAG: hypothetical protein ACE5R6_01435 [Candidatus Heimdallarchaeota archaeon]